METESRGEKRKREDDDEPEEVELQEKKRREDNQDESEEVAPTETADTEAPAPVKERAPPKEDEPELDYEKPQLSWCKFFFATLSYWVILTVTYIVSIVKMSYLSVKTE